MRNRRFLVLWILLVLMLVFLDYGFCAGLDGEEELPLTPVLQQWLDAHKGEEITLGLDPLAGMEYFSDGDAKLGYMLDFASYLGKRLGLKVKIVDDQSWGEVYNGLQTGDIDLLFGANPTPERLKTMAFTMPVYSVPYTVMSQKDGPVKTIGDLHGRRVGFIKEDVGIDLFKEAYHKIEFESLIFTDQRLGLEALSRGEIDGFVTSGGDIVYDYIYTYPNVRSIVQIESIRSELTLSALKENQALIDIIQMVMTKDREAIDAMIVTARQKYVRKLINLTPQEEAWLETHTSVKVGVPTDYLPIDFDDNGQYGGIAGTYFMKVADLVGISVSPVAANFDTVYNLALKGDIDILNMAKTEERLANFIFTDAFSDERDVIYGRRDMPYVYDTYGLEGHSVAVIEGFWHEQYLERNLKSVKIVKTRDIQSSLRLIETGQVDYFIETPAVAEYYIVGLGYTDIITKGETSADSFLYFGAQKEMAPFVSIFNKLRPIVSYDEAKYYGVQRLPQIENIVNKRLYGLLMFALLMLVLLIVIVASIALKLGKQSSEMLLLKERERLIYLDPLTGLYNRSYFNHLEPIMDTAGFPQYIVMLDVNDLKVVNDQHGHLVGDQLIIKFSERLKSLEKSAVAMRMGGDEFVLWIQGVTEADVQSAIQKLRFKCNQIELTAYMAPGIEDRAEQEPVVVQRGVQVAIGYSVRMSATKTVEHALQEADGAMYVDKQHLKKAGV